MNDVITVDMLDEVNLIIDCDYGQALELKEHFSCYAVNYKYHPKFKARAWNGKISFFNTNDRTLPIGLLRELKPFLEKFNYKIKFLFDRNELLKDNSITLEDIQSFHKALYDGCDVYPRDYQENAIYKAVRNKRGILELCTASGKSLIIYSLIRYLNEVVKGKILLVVPSIGLVSQMYDDIKEYGWDECYDNISLLYGNSKYYDPNKKILISTWQSIYKKRQNFFEDFDAVLVDETHQSKSASISNILKKCVYAEYRIGLTGTLPTEEADIYNIYGYLGPKIAEVKSRTLIDRGFLSDIKIVNYILRYPKEEINRNRHRKYSEELKAILENPKRNFVLKDIFDNYIKKSHNVLVLSQRIGHIDEMIEFLKKHYPDRKILKITGEIKAEVREDIRKHIENNDGVILVASYGTLSTGVNIPKLHHVIFASFYKSKIKVLQSIGRGLRKHKSKNKVFVWDIIDDMRYKKQKRKNTRSELGFNYAFLHFLERLNYYKDEGFKFIAKSVKLDDL